MFRYQRLLDNIKQSDERSVEVLLAEIKRTQNLELAEKLHEVMGTVMNRWRRLRNKAGQEVFPIKHHKLGVIHIVDDYDHPRTCHKIFECEVCHTKIGVCLVIVAYDYDIICQQCFYEFK